LGNVAEIVPWSAEVEAQVSATALLGEIELHVPLKGLKDDLDAERARLAKQKERAERDLARTTAKLANEEFVRNAPAQVTARERQRAEELGRELVQLAGQLDKLARLG
jgi:valyl-tRNA synthetase